MDARIAAQLADVERRLIAEFGDKVGAEEVRWRVRRAVASLDAVFFDYVPIFVARRVSRELQATTTSSLVMKDAS